MSKQYLLSWDYAPPAWADWSIHTRTHIAKEGNIDTLLSKVQAKVSGILVAWNDQSTSFNNELQNIVSLFRIHDFSHKKWHPEIGDAKYSFRVHGKWERGNQSYRVVCKMKYKEWEKESEEEFSYSISSGFATLLGQKIGQVEFARYKVHTDPKKQWKVDVYTWANIGTVIAKTQDRWALIEDIHLGWWEELQWERKREFKLKKLQKKSLDWTRQ